MENVCEIIILESEKVNLGSQWWRSNRHGACFRLVKWLRLLSAPLTTFILLLGCKLGVMP